MEYMVEIASILTASVLAMILHEFPKAVMYLLTGRHCKKEDRLGIFKLYQYIDPVGLLLFLVCHAGASRPYPYRLKEKDTNIAIGMVGFLTLIVMVLGGYAVYESVVLKIPAVNSGEELGYALTFLMKTSWYFIYAAFVLLIVNFFPTVTSDMFLLIVAIAPSKLISLLKYDSLIKSAILLCFVFQYIQNAALMGMDFMNEFLGLL